MKSEIINKVRFIFINIVLLLFFIAVCYLCIESIISTIEKTKQILRDFDWEYEIIKRLLKTVIYPLTFFRLLAQTTYIAKSTSKFLRNSINVLIQLSNLIIIIVTFLLLVLILVTTFSFFYEESGKTIENFSNNLFYLIKIEAFTPENKLESLFYYLVIIFVALTFWPQKIGDLEKLYQFSIFRRGLLLILWIPLHIYDTFNKKMNENIQVKLIYDQLKQYLFLLPDEITEKIQDINEVKEFVEEN